MKMMRTLAMSAVLGLVLTPLASGAPKTARHLAAPHRAPIRKLRKAEPTLRKRPGRTKYSNITLKRGYVAPAKLARWRAALRPLLKRPRLRGMRPADAALARRVHAWALQQDRRLQEWSRLAAAYERLEQRRQLAAAHGQPTTQMDRRLAQMLRQITDFSKSFQMQYLMLQQKMRRETRVYSLLSNTMKKKHDTAKNVLEYMR